MKNLILLIIPFLTFVSCKKDENDSVDNFENLDYFYSNSTSLKIDVGYEEGNEPFINSGFFNGVNFEFTQNNITELFAGRSRPISVFIDKQLSEMEILPAQNKQSFNKSELINLAKEYKPNSSTESQNTLYVIFVNGYYDYTGGQIPNQVIGLHMGSNVIAMFKPAINNISNSTERKHIEQKILTHEIGHALGLVDAGVSMINSHLSSTGKHCSNTDCVMYATQGGTMSGSVNEFVFGANCHNDITQYLD